jgi:two-component system chemotaxis sensor kinase CheA
MAEQDEVIRSLLDELAAQILVLEPGDLMAYGDALSRLEQLSVVVDTGQPDPLNDLVLGLKTFMEAMILGQVDDQDQGVKTLASGITLAQSLLRGDSTPDEVPRFLAAQGLAEGEAGAAPPEEPAEPAPEEPSPEPAEAEAAAPEEEPAPAEEPEPVAAEAPPEEPEPAPPEEAAPAPAPPVPADEGGVTIIGQDEGFGDMDEEDAELLDSFVVESLEHLESIEINALLLEDDPQNLETLNAVFRPFHTIKGVSGFLNLGDVNKLAHQLENLLDLARSGEIVLSGISTDVILAGVDMLRQMILESQKAVQEKRARMLLDTSGLITRVGQVIEEEKGGGAEEPEPPKLGEVLVESGVVEPAEVESALEKQGAKPDRHVGEILVHEGVAGPQDVADGLRKQKTMVGATVHEVKVDTGKLDNLLDMVGELVIAQSMVQANPNVAAINDRKLAADMGQLARITSELQKVTMSMRMVPIKQTFQRMVRVVRDTAKKQGKAVRLEMEGEGTEIDRNMVDKFYDPLVHMVRNSVDHGIESAADRVALGKPEEGEVVLAAYHQGGNVCIEIRDDGKGLSREKILAKAIERDLVTEADALDMSDEEIFHFIFKAGFSTAEKVTDISGRGVGMDVVQKVIDSLRGKVSISSQEGHGTTLTIALPLTLAIIDGMVVEVGRERFILPTISVAETLRADQGDYTTVQGRGELIKIRGNLLPLIRLSHVVQVDPNHEEPWEALVVVVEHHGQKRCLMVDRLIGRQEVVIKSLGESLKRVKVVAGGAIMGDGRVGLILDVDGIFKSQEAA